MKTGSSYGYQRRHKSANEMAKNGTVISEWHLINIMGVSA